MSSACSSGVAGDDRRHTVIGTGPDEGRSSSGAPAASVDDASGFLADQHRRRDVVGVVVEDGAVGDLFEEGARGRDVVDQRWP